MTPGLILYIATGFKIETQVSFTSQVILIVKIVRSEPSGKSEFWELYFNIESELRLTLNGQMNRMIYLPYCFYILDTLDYHLLGFPFRSRNPLANLND